jgi:hypothetical protein
VCCIKPEMPGRKARGLGLQTGHRREPAARAHEAERLVERGRGVWKEQWIVERDRVVRLG